MARICGAGRRVGGGDRECCRDAGHEPPHRDGSGAEWTDEAVTGGQPNPELLSPETAKLDDD